MTLWFKLAEHFNQTFQISANAFFFLCLFFKCVILNVSVVELQLTFLQNKAISVSKYLSLLLSCSITLHKSTAKVRSLQKKTNKKKLVSAAKSEGIHVGWSLG